MKRSVIKYPFIVCLFAYDCFAASEGSATNALPKTYFHKANTLTLIYNRNIWDEITKEINRKSFHELLSAHLNLPVDIVAAQKVRIDSVKFEVFGAVINETNIEAYRTLINMYGMCRVKGHSEQYCLDSARQKFKPNLPPDSETEDPYLLRLKLVFQSIPTNWLKEDVENFDAYKLPLTKIFYVVDGRITWTYHVPLSGPVEEILKDSVEYDPKHKATFQKAKKEVYAVFSLKRQPKPSELDRDFQFLLKEYLKDKYNIDYTTPVRLNPGRFMHSP